MRESPYKKKSVSTRFSLFLSSYNIYIEFDYLLGVNQNVILFDV